MNDRIDVIEVLRRVNPVPLGAIDESALPTAAQLRASLSAPSTTVPTISLDQPATHGGRRWPRYAAAAAALAAGIAAFSLLPRNEDPVEPAATTEISTPPPAAGPFLGVWLSTDTDGFSQTMEIELSGDGSAHMTLHDAAATVLCSGAAAAVTGTGALDSRGDLVVTISGLSCEDGSEPRLSAPIESGYTFTYHRQSDTLTDNSGVVWRREGTDDPSPVPPSSGAMWPQSSLDEAREAQELADAGDPAYTWQVDPQLSSQEWWGYLRQPGAEIVERFLREELGWDHALFNPYQGDDGDGAADGVIRGIVYLRCAPGGTNPLYPTAPEGHQEAPGAELCGPTIDEFRYETVALDLSQPVEPGLSGIWVVSRWATTAPFAQTDPDAAEAEATTLLEDFLRARIEGHGAEGYVEVDGALSTQEEVPLLYATTTGARYERSEIERVSGPQWPDGNMKFTVRLFAEGGKTVVEQPISLSNTRLTLDATQTTENGQPLALSYVFFDGDVTLSAADPWEVSWRFALALTLGDQAEERIELVADSFPVGCARGPAPSDAIALASSIQSDPDLQVTAPVGVSVGGVEGLAMDITVAPGASVCEVSGGPGRGDLDQGSRMRLYLIDLPEGSATRTLAIAVVAPEARFEVVFDAAAPIIESVEFHPGGS